MLSIRLWLVLKEAWVSRKASSSTGEWKPPPEKCDIPGTGTRAVFSPRQRRPSASSSLSLSRYPPGACRHNPCLHKAWEYAWAGWVRDMGKQCATQKQRKKARQFFQHALRLAPFSPKTWLRHLRFFLP